MLHERCEKLIGKLCRGKAEMRLESAKAAHIRYAQ